MQMPRSSILIDLEFEDAMALIALLDAAAATTDNEEQRDRFLTIAHRIAEAPAEVVEGAAL